MSAENPENPHSGGLPIESTAAMRVDQSSAYRLVVARILATGGPLQDL